MWEFCGYENDSDLKVRPRKADRSEIRTREVRFRVSDREYAIMEEEAKVEAETLGEFSRSQMLRVVRSRRRRRDEQKFAYSEVEFNADAELGRHIRAAFSDDEIRLLLADRWLRMIDELQTARMLSGSFPPI